MPARSADLRQHLAASLPPTLAALLGTAARQAWAQGTPLHLVGGAVRDLLLGRPALDLDLVLAGDMQKLAEGLAAEYGLALTAHRAFGTFTLHLAGLLVPPPPANAHLDLITARSETYPAPAALPRVTPGTLAADLARRDFTINALALPLDPPGGALLDPHSGQADLAARLIRVLHDGSFVDDPTRIFRAVRYEQRFGFQIEPHTLRLLQAGVGGIARLSGGRVRNELLRILEEADPALVLARLAALGALAAIDSVLGWDARNAADIQQVHAALAQTGDGENRAGCLLAVWLSRLPGTVVARLADHLRLDKPTAHLARELATARAVLPRALADSALPPSARAALLRPYAGTTLDLLVALADSPALAQAVQVYKGQQAEVRPLLTGADLQALGLPPGPPVRQLLDALRDARLDGRVHTRADEERLVQAALRDGL